MNKNDVEIYKNHPEGSPQRTLYDKYFLDFQDYLNKYYSFSDLSRWNYINEKFVIPLFDGTAWEDYWNFLCQAKPNFTPNETKKNEFWNRIKDDLRFDIELKQFFTFLYSIDFFKDLSFEQWLNAKNWMHPWYVDENENSKSILELIELANSENYLKNNLGQLSIF